MSAEVPSATGERLDLLQRLGFGDLEHDSHVPFLSHLLGTRRLLVQWGERPALCDAGLFHSATVRRNTFDVETATAVDRNTVLPVELGPRLMADLATLWAADTVEQIARMSPDARDFARSLARVVHLASPHARAAVDAVRPLLDGV